MAAALLLLAGCEDQVDVSFVQCELEIALFPTEGVVGADVVATGRPFSDISDTSVRFGGAEAQLLDVARDDCSVCDTCRTNAVPACDVCVVCPQCRSECADCVQTVTFRVPEVPPGETSVVVTNGYGVSPPLPFTVLAPDTGDTGDSGR